MKLIKASYQIIKPSGYTIDDIYKSIELAGRVSYKSEDKITKDSAKKFVDMLIKKKHYGPLEFGIVYLKVPTNILFKYTLPDYMIGEKYCLDHDYVQCFIDGLEDIAYISSNYRWIIENNLEELLDYLCEPTEFHHKMYCVKFTLPISISREFIRHRSFSFMEMSTRYCNFSSNKFGNEITFISPSFDTDYINSPGYKEWESALINAENSYNNLISLGYKPQEARGILPLDTKTELYMCGFVESWEHFFSLRCHVSAHPQARELAIPLRDEFINKGYISHNK